MRFSSLLVLSLLSFSLVAQSNQSTSHLEKIVLARAIKAHVEHKVLVFGNKTVIFS